MRTTHVTLLVAALVLVVLALGAPASAYHTRFQYTCNNSFFNDNPITRAEARDYAYVAAAEDRKVAPCRRRVTSRPSAEDE